MLRRRCLFSCHRNSHHVNTIRRAKKSKPNGHEGGEHATCNNKPRCPINYSTTFGGLKIFQENKNLILDSII